MPVRGKEWFYLREVIIYERDRFCERCGKSVPKPEPLFLHPKDKNPENKDRENLELLCAICLDKARYELFFNRICQHCHSSIPDYETYCPRCGIRWDGVRRL